MTPAAQIRADPAAFFAAGLDRFDEGMEEALKILDLPEVLDPVAWVEKHVPLSRETTGQTQEWKLYGYQRGILQRMCDPDVEILAIPKSTRTGITQLLLGCVAYWIGHRRSQAMVVQPIESKAQAFVNNYLNPAFRDSDFLKTLVRKPKKGERQDTWNEQTYNNGGGCQTGWASTDETFRGNTSDLLAADEFDADSWEPTEGSQGDKGDLFLDRGETRASSRLIAFSSPTRKATSRIWPLWEDSQQHRYFVPCPHPGCGKFQWLKWGGRDTRYGVKPHYGADGELKSALYMCEHCEELIEDDKETRAWMDENGEWRNVTPAGKVTRPGVVGMHISALYSQAPKSSWTKLWEQWTRAQGDPDKLKAFINTKLGEPWDDVVTNQRIDEHEFAKRAVRYEAEIPRHCFFITAFTDRQKGMENPDDPNFKGPRYETTVMAWGAGEQGVVVGHYVLDKYVPGTPEAEAELDKIVLHRKWVRADGLKMGIVVSAHDAGDEIDEVTRYVEHPNRIRTCVATRGEGEVGKNLAPILMAVMGETDKFKRKFFRIGTRTAKNVVMARLKQETPGPGYITFPTSLADVHPDYYKGLFAERSVTDRKGMLRWERINKKNTGEPWDCLVGNLVAIRVARKRYDKVDRFMQPPAVYKAPPAWEGEDRSDMAVVYNERLLAGVTSGQSASVSVRATRDAALPKAPPPRPAQKPMVFRPKFR